MNQEIIDLRRQLAQRKLTLLRDQHYVCSAMLAELRNDRRLARADSQLGTSLSQLISDELSRAGTGTCRIAHLENLLERLGALVDQAVQ